MRVLLLVPGEVLGGAPHGVQKRVRREGRLRPVGGRSRALRASSPGPQSGSAVWVSSPGQRSGSAVRVSSPGQQSGPVRQYGQESAGPYVVLLIRRELKNKGTCTPEKHAEKSPSISHARHGLSSPPAAPSPAAAIAARRRWAHANRLCRSERKKRAIGGQCRKTCRMQFMKHVWPRLFRPRLMRDDSAALRVPSEVSARRRQDCRRKLL